MSRCVRYAVSCSDVRNAGGVPVLVKVFEGSRSRRSGGRRRSVDDGGVVLKVDGSVCAIRVYSFANERGGGALAGMEVDG